MGKPMVRNLLKAGYAVRVYDVVEASVASMVETGAVAAVSSADVAAHSDLIVTMLPDGVFVTGDAALDGAGRPERHLWSAVDPERIWGWSPTWTVRRPTSEEHG